MPSESPAVSVVLPTYNRERSILAAVNSVRAQTFADFELIVVDDCSTDCTVEILRAIDDSRLRVIAHETNAGGSAARNTGLKAARAPYVAFQDSDDEWLATKLEKQMARMAVAGPEFVGCYCGMIVLNAPLVPAPGVHERPRVRYVPSGGRAALEGDVLEALLLQSLISTQTFLVRRDVLDEIGGFDATLAALQDWDCVLRVARRGQIALVDEPLVLQRFSPDSLSRSWRNRLAARKRIVEKNLDMLARRPGILSEHYHVIAGAHYSLGEVRESRRWLLEALRVSPLRPRTWFNLARGLLRADGVETGDAAPAPPSPSGKRGKP
jgi:glycosyltransferase involved in cell wall biosynthesis